MKVTISLISFLSYSLAVAAIDWANVNSKIAYVQPANNLSLPVLPRVVGGREAVRNSRPYQVAIIIDARHFCGGSLISNNFVLTAAHCIEGHVYFQVILGAHDVRQIESSQMIVTSTSSIVHPDYDPTNYNNDVGLIRLPNGIVLNQYIQAIPLASAASGSFVDYEAVLSGWGRLSDADSTIASALHEVDVSIMANFWCSRTYGEVVIIDSTLCTSGVGGIGGCDGDSGSPLVVEGVQVGIASFVAGTGCQAGLPTGYARITSFRDWILKTAEF